MQAVADAGVMVTVAEQPIPLAMALADRSLLAKVETPTDKEKLVQAYAKVKGLPPDEARVALNEKSPQELLADLVKIHAGNLAYSGKTPEEIVERSQQLADQIAQSDPEALFKSLLDSWAKGGM